MPIYSFECLKCKEAYDDLGPYDESGKYSKVKCPKCKSNRKRRTFAGSNVVIKGVAKPAEVAFGYKYEQAQEDRRRAKEQSHMGDKPYINLPSE